MILEVATDIVKEEVIKMFRKLALLLIRSRGCHGHSGGGCHGH